MSLRTKWRAAACRSSRTESSSFDGDLREDLCLKRTGGATGGAACGPAGGQAGERAGARLTRPLGSAPRARARSCRTPPPASDLLAGPCACRAAHAPFASRDPGPHAPGAPSLPGGRAPPPAPAPAGGGGGGPDCFCCCRGRKSRERAGSLSPDRALPPPLAQRSRLRGAASAPIFRRASVTRRRRGPEREAPGTGARRPPPPPWRRWDPVRSALGLGSDPGLGRADGRAEGTVAVLPPLARTRLPAARPRKGRSPMPSSLGGGDRAPAEDCGSVQDWSRGRLREGSSRGDPSPRGWTDRSGPWIAVHGRSEADWDLKWDRVSGARGGLAQNWKAFHLLSRVFLMWDRISMFALASGSSQPALFCFIHLI